MRLSITTLTLLVAAVTASAVPSAPEADFGRRGEHAAPQINPPESVVQNTKRDTIPAGHRKVTNAQRFARGLPPVAPRKLWSRANSARTPVTSNGPVHTVQGRIRATRASTNPSSPEYISSVFNKFGEYGRTTDANQALVVSFEVPDVPAVVDKLDLTIVSPAKPEFPFLSAVQGFSTSSANLLTTSSNYAYIAASGSTPPGTTPQDQTNSFTDATVIKEYTESAIWVYDPSTNKITAKWINIGGAEATSTFIYCDAPNDTYLLVGNADKFRQTFGTCDDVVLTFEQI